MLYIIRDIMFIFFAIVGLIEVIRGIILYLMQTKYDKDVFVVIPIFKNNDSVEMLLRHTAIRVKWLGGSRINRVVCLDCDTDEETKLICEKICEEYEFMEFDSEIEI